MKVIFGLGNPEQKYNGTRHNVGFWALDMIASQQKVTFKLEQKFKALIATTVVEGEKILLVKPHTYYNQVGESARAIIDFYKLAPEDVLIIHDDLALPLGTVRTRVGGSDGGNNGLKSLAAHIGQETSRVRIGVWTDHHYDADKVSVVLGKFLKAEQATLDTHRELLDTIVQSFATGTFVATTY